MAELERLLSDKAAFLTLPVVDLLSLVSIEQLNEAAKNTYQSLKPQLSQHLLTSAGAILTKGGSHGIGMSGLQYATRGAIYTRRLKTLFKLLDQFIVAQPVLALPDKEQQILRSIATLTVRNHYTPEQWSRFLALLIWSDGTCLLEPHPSILAHKALAETQAFLRSTLQSLLPTKANMLAEAGSYIAATVKIDSSVSAAPLHSGAHWLTADELKSSRYYSTQPTPHSLILGYHPERGDAVYFNGHESLITIAGAGAGKSQTQVIPNLFRYKGSAIVLDIKGELWKATAGYRAKNFGPVFRFDPVSLDGQSHRYNPFDAISRTPEQAVIECMRLALQMIPENPETKDPYWENSARTYLGCFAAVLALRAPKERRNLFGLAEILYFPLDKNPTSDMHKVLTAMRDLGNAHRLLSLTGTSDGIRTGLGNKDVQSIFNIARGCLTSFTTGARLDKLLATSDWRPEDFRKRAGTTLYITLSSQDLAVFAPLVRILIQQHADILLRQQVNPDDLPITFFLDEMPQLGNFKSILTLQNVGRSSGLRLWMFAQTVGQLATAFGDKQYQSVIDGCRCKSFMESEQQVAQSLKSVLGYVKNIFTGEGDPLARLHELMGRAYGDKIILATRAENAMLLNKRYAYVTDKDKFLPPPVLNTK